MPARVPAAPSALTVRSVPLRRSVRGDAGNEVGMHGRRVRLVLLGAVTLAVIAGAGPARAASSIKVSPPSAAAQVTNDPNALRSHSSPQIVVNPKTGELVTV